VSLRSPPVILLYFQAETAGVHPWNETQKQGRPDHQTSNRAEIR
jgi:hypothetical protein